MVYKFIVRCKNCKQKLYNMSFCNNNIIETRFGDGRKVSTIYKKNIKTNIGNIYCTCEKWIGFTTNNNIVILNDKVFF